MLPPIETRAAIQAMIREDWGRILSYLTGYFGDVGLAEDSLQDALEIALRRWPEHGTPRSPAAWLCTAAKNKARDHIRRDRTLARRIEDLAFMQETHSNNGGDLTEDIQIPDKRLEMMFTCCHPALSEKSRIALTLRTLGGLTTEEIAGAFLDKRTAMAQRLTRAKAKIRLANIPYKIPSREDLPERLGGVLSVIYLIFNEGYAASTGKIRQRISLIDEAVRLARIMTALLPEETEISGLLALMLLHDARRLARTDETETIIPLEQQNRQLWDAAKASEGQAILVATMQKKRIGPYQIQAAISALHVEAASWLDTDWPQIFALYTLLYQLTPSPVVLINQAVAASYAKTPEAGLEILALIPAETMATYQPYHAASADLFLRAGKHKEAVAAFKNAIALSDNDSEIQYLERRLSTI